MMSKFMVVMLALGILVGCSGNKEMAAQIMADLKTNPPVKSVSVTKAGTTKTEYHDTTSVLMKLTSLLMVNEALEWSKVFVPLVGSVGGNWVSSYYRSKDTAVMWEGISDISGDRYTLDGGSGVVQGESTFSPTAYAPVAAD